MINVVFNIPCERASEFVEWMDEYHPAWHISGAASDDSSRDGERIAIKRNEKYGANGWSFYPHLRFPHLSDIEQIEITMRWNTLRIYSI